MSLIKFIQIKMKVNYMVTYMWST